MRNPMLVHNDDDDDENDDDYDDTGNGFRNINIKPKYLIIIIALLKLIIAITL